jgi:hypothetical protein
LFSSKINTSSSSSGKLSNYNTNMSIGNPSWFAT